MDRSDEACARKVAVTLIDGATGEVLANTDMQPADLPESFEVETTLHLGESRLVDRAWHRAPADVAR